MSFEASFETPVPPTLHPIMVRLADEGVPIRVVARACSQPSEEVRDILTDAVQGGYLSELPVDDWPPTARRADRFPAFMLRKVDDVEVLTACMRVFKVTLLQATLLAVLLKRPEVERFVLHNAIQSLRAQRSQGAVEETEPKMVDVVICHLRKKLKPHQLTIKTLWSRGYFMERQDREKALRMISEFLGIANVETQHAPAKTQAVAQTGPSAPAH